MTPPDYSDLAEEVLDCIRYERKSLPQVIRAIEDACLRVALSKAPKGHGRVTEVARILNMGRTTVHERIKTLEFLDGQG